MLHMKGRHALHIWTHHSHKLSLDIHSLCHNVKLLLVSDRAFD